MEEKSGFRDKIKQINLPKAFREPSDRPFASLNNMSAEEFESALNKIFEESKK